MAIEVRVLRKWVATLVLGVWPVSLAWTAAAATLPAATPDAQA